MSWFKRTEKGISTPTEQKKDVPDGLWFQCSSCKKVMQTKDHAQHAYTCIDCNHHARIGSKEYFELLFDNNEFTELDENMSSSDPLEFTDSQPYPNRIIASQKKSELKDAVRSAYGKIND